MHKTLFWVVLSTPTTNSTFPMIAIRLCCQSLPTLNYEGGLNRNDRLSSVNQQLFLWIWPDNYKVYMLPVTWLIIADKQVLEIIIIIIMKFIQTSVFSTWVITSSRSLVALFSFLSQRWTQPAHAASCSYFLNTNMTQFAQVIMQNHHPTRWFFS